RRAGVLVSAARTPEHERCINALAHVDLPRADLRAAPQGQPREAAAVDRPGAGQSRARWVDGADFVARAVQSRPSVDPRPRGARAQLLDGGLGPRAPEQRGAQVT